MKEFLVGDGLGRLVGFWAVCCQACFAYEGVEIIALTADEVERPRQTIPKAVRRVANRIVIYYVGCLFALGVNLSANDPLLQSFVNNPQGSYQGPFVLMAQRAGLIGLGHLLNAMALIASLSVANAALFVTVHLDFSNQTNANRAEHCMHLRAKDMLQQSS